MPLKLVHTPEREMMPIFLTDVPDVTVILEGTVRRLWADSSAVNCPSVVHGAPYSCCSTEQQHCKAAQSCPVKRSLERAG